jgi:hypothetical protein
MEEIQLPDPTVKKIITILSFDAKKLQLFHQIH